MLDNDIRSSVIKCIDNQLKNGNSFFCKHAASNKEGGLSLSHFYSKFDVVKGKNRSRQHYEWHIGKNHNRLSLGFHIESDAFSGDDGRKVLEFFGLLIKKEFDQLFHNTFKLYNYFNGSPSNLGQDHFLCNREGSKHQYYWWFGFDICDINEFDKVKNNVMLLSRDFTTVIEKNRWILDYFNKSQ
jgi:hypothetical protein